MSALPTSHPQAPSLWDALPSSVLLLSRDGRALHVNTAFCAFTGLTAAAAQGRGWLAAVAPAAQPALLAALHSAEDFSLQLQWQCVQGEGSLREAWVDCAGRWRAEHGGHVCVLHDMSQARRAEQAARAQAEQLRLLADNVPALIAYYAAGDNTCLFANKQYAQTFGWDEHSIVGRNVTDIIGEAAEQQIQPHVDIVLQQQRPVVYERRLQRPDGSAQ
ncbi:MAG: PAS domain S-box protein, partial [Methylibium sp.]|nr:PAS domain S-box protein [Methylibium sp.]